MGSHYAGKMIVVTGVGWGGGRRGTGAGIVRAFGERSLGWLEYWSLGEEGPRGLMSVGRRSLDSCFIKSNLQGK